MFRETLMVTGAGGFIGRAVTESLSHEGYRVVACVSPRSTLPFARGIPVCRMSLPDEHFGDLVSRERPRWLIHCAGSASVGASLQDPTQDWKANVGVTSGLYGALAKYSPETNVVFLSSAAVYGQPSILPITEATPVAPISPYGLHKRTCELIGSDYEKRLGMKCINLRVFSAYGPGLRKQVLWDIYRKAMTASTVLLDGTGQETRDLIHVNDIARLIVNIVIGRCQPPSIVNVASGVSIEIARLAEQFLKLLGLNRNIRFSGERKGGIPSHWAVDNKIFQHLPGVEISELNTGLQAYANWINYQDGDGDASRVLVAAG